MTLSDLFNLHLIDTFILTFMKFLFAITHEDNIKLYFKNGQTFQPQGALVSGYYIQIMYIKNN